MKDAKSRRTIDAGCVVIGLIDRGEGTGQDQDLEWHDDPDRVKAQHKHFCPVRSVDEIHGPPPNHASMRLISPSV